MKHPIFKSVKSHMKKLLNERDDFESLGYMIRYF